MIRSALRRKLLCRKGHDWRTLGVIEAAMLRHVGLPLVTTCRRCGESGFVL